MAGRHAVTSHRADDLWAYLDRWTLATYARDFFTAEHHRSIIGVICGVMFIIDGVARMFTDPGVPSLGVIFVGTGVAAFCFLVPILSDLALAYKDSFFARVKRKRG